MANERFLTLTDVAEVLNTSVSQVYALVRRGELPAIKIGGRVSGGSNAAGWSNSSPPCMSRLTNSWRGIPSLIPTCPTRPRPAAPPPPDGQPRRIAAMAAIAMT